jgi:hypothetical protein
VEFKLYYQQNIQPKDLTPFNICVSEIVDQELEGIHFRAPKIKFIDYGKWTSIASHADIDFDVHLEALLKKHSLPLLTTQNFFSLLNTIKSQYGIKVTNKIGTRLQIKNKQLKQ